LAIIKDEDWLKKSALEVLEENRENIETSVLALAEVVIILKRDYEIENFSPLVRDILSFCDLMHADEETVLQAMFYIDEKNSTIFDAFHAALSEGMPILSSDEFYEDIDTENKNFRNK
jgi:predicted nucleic acid-binding protein